MSPGALRAAAAAVVVLALAGCVTMKQSKLLAPSWFGMEQIGPRVWVAKDVPSSERRALLEAYDAARPFVAAMFGSIVTAPTVYGCAVRECIETFGGTGDGTAAREVTPAILLWTRSFIPSALAHEWSHLELLTRLGDSARGVPMWFHEGLGDATGGDMPRHSEALYQEAVASGVPIPTLDELRLLKQWGPAHQKYANPKVNLPYTTAAHEVRRWLQRVGRAGLLELIEARKSGEPFDTAYRRIEERAAAPRKGSGN